MNHIRCASPTSAPTRSPMAFRSAIPPMHSFLGVPLVIRGEAWGNLYLAEKDGGEFDEGDEEAILTLADWAATAIENARLYRSERERRGELERAVRGLEATTEIARAVGGETRLDRILELIVKRGRALVEARGMVILLLEGDNLVMTAVAGPGAYPPDRDACRHCRHHLRRCHPRSAAAADRPQRAWLEFRPGRVDRRQGGTDRAPHVPRAGGGSARGLRPQWRQSRVLGRGRAHHGGVRSERCHGRRHGTGCRRADAAAQHRRVRPRAGTLGARAARRDAAKSSALKITLSGTQRSETPEALREGIATALDYSDHAIAGLREIISDLRPGALDALGTQAALETLVDRVRTRVNLDVEMSIDLAFESGRSATRHIPALESAVYRITQEAITNTIKHAEAKRVTVVLTEVDDVLTLSVEDDGRGFDHERDRAPGSACSGSASAWNCSVERFRSHQGQEAEPVSTPLCPSRGVPTRRPSNSKRTRAVSQAASEPHQAPCRRAGDVDDANHHG